MIMLTAEQAELRLADKPWSKGEITKVEDASEGWHLTDDDNWGTYLSRDQLGEREPPAVGDTLAVYTVKGSTIRGIDLRGEPLFYKTQAELDSDHQEWSNKFNTKLKKEFEEAKEQIDQDFANLPPEFQQRILWFREHNADFRWQFEKYEMFVCTEAIKIANQFPSIEQIEAFSNADSSSQLAAGLSDEHSGNTFGASIHLAKLYKKNPILVIAAHGALTPLVGCTEYGCVHPRPQYVLDALEEVEP